MNDFANRLTKLWSKRKAWAAKESTDAFRVYDLDIPEWPFAVDWYAGLVHISEYPSRKQRGDGVFEQKRLAVRAACAQVLGVAEGRVHLKRHEPITWGEAPALAAEPATLHQVTEHGLRFEVDLTSHLDTGLFLDHRPTRALVRKQSAGKRVLNLFAYTGAFTVHARAGEASHSTTVDLSQTYCDWAERNLALNDMPPDAAHRVIRADVLAWIERDTGTYDLAVVDPPSFSTSKKMGRRFEIQRDHLWLVERVLARLAPGGVAYFSTNFTEFQLDPRLAQAEPVDSIPRDFRRSVHQCWKLRR